MAKARPVSVRLDDALIQRLQGLAIIDGVTVAEEIRGACEAFVRSRQAEPGFQDQLERAVERQEAVLRALQSA